jgi:hypothetical protein
MRTEFNIVSRSWRYALSLKAGNAAGVYAFGGNTYAETETGPPNKGRVGGYVLPKCRRECQWELLQPVRVRTDSRAGEVR